MRDDVPTRVIAFIFVVNMACRREKESQWYQELARVPFCVRLVQIQIYNTWAMRMDDAIKAIRGGGRTHLE